MSTVVLNAREVAMQIDGIIREAGDDLQRGLMDGARHLAADIRSAAPVRSGRLRRGIVSAASGDGAMVSVDSRVAPHARFVEFGVRARRGLMAMAVGGSVVFRRRARAIPARPFFGVTVDQRGDEALSVAAARTAREIEP